MCAYLVLIPTLIGDEPTTALLPSLLLELNSLRHFIVENEKAARRFIKQAGVQTPQKELNIKEYSKHSKETLSAYMEPLLAGHNVGLMSDAGCPGVADPGADIVREAHRRGIRVVPRVGASSIILALMASGLNGQSFSFHGYIPINRQEKRQRLKQMESDSSRFKQTQIWIETPFRNNAHIIDLLEMLSPTTKLCIAAGITTVREYISTRQVRDWQSRFPDLDNIPAVFLLSS